MNAPRCLLPLLLIALFTLPALGQSCPSTVWADEFDGTTLDTSKWSYQTGDGCSEGICGWGNNELQYYKAENVTVGGGTLQITAKKERVQSKKYTSGRIRTLNLGEWTSGRFEARIKIPQGQGLWPAFWMLPTDEVYGGWPQSGEIDIMENVGHELRTTHGTIHFGDAWPNNQSSGASFNRHAAQSIFADGFHEFAIEREAGVIRWYVDDILYSTKTTADVAPHIWPFDERFHFLLNVAVGGNWPGAPDGSTSFPQTLEADYVRVYDGTFPYLSGSRVVANQSAGETYSVGNLPNGTSVTWSVPAGATITSGQGSDTVTIDWGMAGGDVTASFSWACGSEVYTMNVDVEPPYSYDFSFENFDAPGSATFDAARTTGTLNEVSNPDASGVNTSALVGAYTRDAAEQWDVLFYDTAAIPDAGAYVAKDKKFYLDVYTAAPVGTEVLLQLENSATATSSNFPTGRHSRYQAVTTIQNGWERLTFSYLDQPDPGTPDNSVDDLLLLFAPNSFTSDLYYLDNLDSYGTGGGTGGTPTAVHVEALSTGTQGAGGGNKYATATITLHDDLGAPVADATVTGTFTGDYNETLNGVTAADGTVTLVTNSTQKGNVSFSFCVDDVTHATLPYDAAANTQTCTSGKRGALAGALADLPTDYALQGAYPNPFNPTTTIRYDVPEAVVVRLAVYDLMGREVRVLQKGPVAAGRHQARFDATGLPSGLYLYRLDTPAGTFTDRLLLVK